MLVLLASRAMRTARGICVSRMELAEMCGQEVCFFMHVCMYVCMYVCFQGHRSWFGG